MGEPDGSLPLGASWSDALADGVILVERGRVTSINLAAARLLDVDRDWALGAPLIAVLRDHRLEEAAAGSEPIELDVRGKRLLVVPVQGGMLLQDLTALRRAESDARELLAVLSHELRTPATTISATLDALADDLAEPDRARFLARGRSEAKRLARLLDDLTVEVRPPRERSVRLEDVVTRALASLQPVLEQRRVRVRGYVGDVTVWADEDKVLQVVLNLVENAVLHGPAGGVVDVVAWPEEDRIFLEVRDQGAPIDPETAEAFFALHAQGG
ncbi:MAG: histidine kinase dimerization/phospho-acceptor domain-containing protein, partial [Trueperaceae bacterium]